MTASEKTKIALVQMQCGTDPAANLAKAIARDKKASAAWDRLSFTNKKEVARSLEEAKKPETRERRLAAALAKLRG